MIEFIYGMLMSAVLILFIGYIDILYFNQIPKVERASAYWVYASQTAIELGFFCGGMILMYILKTNGW